MSYYSSKTLDAPFDDTVVRVKAALTHEALLLEDKVGLMLPCNVIVQEAGDGLVEVAVIDPAASMHAIDNAAPMAQAAVVGEKPKSAFERL